MSRKSKKEHKEYFTDAQIEAMKKEARDSDGDFFEIYRRETEKLLGKLNIENLNQFLLDSHYNSPAIDYEAFAIRMKELNKKYPTAADKKRAFNLMRKGYDV